MNKLTGTIRVYINLIKPVKMSLRQTMRHMPQTSQVAPAAASGNNNNAPVANGIDPNGGGGLVPNRLISFFLPRGGSRVLQLSR